MTEVKTSAGWMIVGSNTRWIGLTHEGRLLDLAAMRQDKVRRWSKRVKDPAPPIFNDDFTWVYGLYGRHARLFAPYNAIPDVNWSEMAENI